MKFIHLSDTHLLPPGQQTFDMDPAAYLDSCLESIREKHPDAELMVFGGDLTYNGQESAYRALARGLEGFPLKALFIPGNHDDRKLMAEILPGVGPDEAGFLHQVRQTRAGAFILLDTQSGPHDSRNHHGLLCPVRMEWLSARLEENRDRPVYLFMHHPPFASGLAFMDRTRLREPQKLAALLKPHSNIRHLFIGHLHRAVSGSWQDIPFSIPGATSFQLALDLGEKPDLTISLEPPSYAVVKLAEDSTIVHLEYFLDRSPKIKVS